ncbi:unnamed protein product [Haemonchus placei]|uniref:SH2 domain-containing protein n=1 Tax=Haemonchus placei TaxID=6290 RepID=A0A0N4WDG4_HAEPC|nr:unnamed protein product [Haemonchus placei]
MGSMADDADVLERCFYDSMLESDAEYLYEPEEESGFVPAVVRDPEDFDTDETDECHSDTIPNTFSVIHSGYGEQLLGLVVRTQCFFDKPSRHYVVNIKTIRNLT